VLNYIVIFALTGATGLLLVRRAAISIWAICLGLCMAILNQLDYSKQTLLILGFVEVIFLLGSIRPLRRNMLSRHLLKLLQKAMPSMSKTEREALEAGTVRWEGEIFSGAPDFHALRSAPVIALTEEEQAFLDGPVNTLCAMIDDWDITHNRTDLPPEVWQFIKDNRFLGMIIPKQYGGLEFSATAQMSILVKIYGRSVTAATTISVPNSLGPGELLLKYGTEAQKDYYLPRLADGREIPCFALTGPNAGSDAASIPDTGIVSRQLVQGKEEIGILLNWDKRYITLCPVATVLGLAFRLYDPENLLGMGHDIGISCALIPVSTKGVITGRRHFPLNTGFLNGPTQGKNVFIPLDYLIGGVTRAGQGWKMLMECLSAGRAISLPSSANGGAQVVALATGAYSRIRRQFNQPIAHFEGIEEPLARIAGKTYIIDAALTMAAAAIDGGEKPSVAGAILKYHTTEFLREIACDAMDIHGGKGICLGPNNYLGRGFQSTPIGITVEGANILTRNLIIFGQGAIRCHPYIFAEMESLRRKDLVAFDKAFFGHLSFILSNFFQSALFSITDAYGIKAPASSVRHYYQLVHKYSANLAFLADFCMIVLGSKLKRKEQLSARLGDMLSNLYLTSAVLKRFYEEGEPDSDLPLVQWSCQFLLYRCEMAMQGVLSNFPALWARIFLRLILIPFGPKRTAPKDKLIKQVAQILTSPNETRQRLGRLVYTEPVERCPVGKMEDAFHKICAVEQLEKRLIKAAKEHQLTSLTAIEMIEEAALLNLFSKEEINQLKEAEYARQSVIKVDDFADDELRRESAHVVQRKRAAVKRDEEEPEAV